MPNRHLFSSHACTLRRLVIGCGLVLIAALSLFKASAPHSHAAMRQQLSFEDRVAAGARHRGGLPSAPPLAHGQVRSPNRRSTRC